MSKQVRRRRGTEAEINAMIPAGGEFISNTDDNSIHTGDGVKLGGYKIPAGDNAISSSDLAADGGAALVGNAAIQFDTVADMLAADWLAIGNVAQTAGYYVAGDGGGAEYLISSAQAVDGFGDHGLSNGLVALVQLDMYINVLQYGANGYQFESDISSAIDSAPAIQAALDAAPRVFTQINSQRVGADVTVFFPAAIYVISSTLTLDRFTTIVADGSIITPSAAMGSATGIDTNAWELSIQGLALQGFIGTALNLFNTNENSGMIVIRDCHFGTNGLDIQIDTRSSCIFISGTRFESSTKLMHIILCDKVSITNCWLAYQRSVPITDLDYSPITQLAGLLVIDNVIAVPWNQPNDPLTENAWVTITDKARVIITDSRFGGEGSGGITLVNCFDSVYTNNTAIRISNVWNSFDSVQANPIPDDKLIAFVRVRGHYPREIRIDGCGSGLKAIALGFSNGTDPASLAVEYFISEDQYFLTPSISISSLTARMKKTNDSDREAMGRTIQDPQRKWSMPVYTAGIDLQKQRIDGISLNINDTEIVVDLQLFREYRKPVAFEMSANVAGGQSGDSGYGGRIVSIVGIVGFFDGSNQVYKLTNNEICNFAGGSDGLITSTVVEVEWVTTDQVDKSTKLVSDFNDQHLTEQIRFRYVGLAYGKGYTIKALDDGDYV